MTIKISMNIKKLFYFICIFLDLKSAEIPGPLIQSGTLQGRREHQEDRYIAYAIVPHGLIAAVFDGHGGEGVSQFLQDNLVSEFMQCSKYENNPVTVWKKTIENLDKQVCRNSFFDKMGSTAIIAHISILENKIFLIGVGDSKGYVSNRTETIARIGEGADIHNGINAENLKQCIAQFGKGNKANNEMLIDVDYEQNRIFIHKYKQGKGGRINMATAIGDKCLELPNLSRNKQPVAPLAEIRTIDIPENSFNILLCSDGVSDAVTDPLGIILSESQNYASGNFLVRQDAVSNLLVRVQSNEKIADNKTAVLLSIFNPSYLSDWIDQELKKQNQILKNKTSNKNNIISLAGIFMILAITYYWTHK